MEQETPQVGRCRSTTEHPLIGHHPLWCELPHGHAGRHHATIPQPGHPDGRADWDDQPPPWQRQLVDTLLEHPEADVTLIAPPQMGARRTARPELPTQAEMFAQATERIRQARVELSASLAWLRSDWKDCDTTPLPESVGAARVKVREEIAAACRALDNALDELGDVALIYNMREQHQARAAASEKGTDRAE